MQLMSTARRWRASQKKINVTTWANGRCPAWGVWPDVPLFIVMTQISTSPVPQKHIVMSHNSPWRDPKSTSPVPKHHLVQSQNSSGYDHKSTSPVPKSDLALSHISSLYDSISTSPVPKDTSSCSIICLVMTQYQLLLSPKVTLFVP
jgi:hypothetical protein